MKEEFIQERIENENVAALVRCLTGWEAVVFELEDEPAEEWSSSP